MRRKRFEPNQGITSHIEPDGSMTISLGKNSHIYRYNYKSEDADIVVGAIKEGAEREYFGWLDAARLSYIVLRYVAQELNARK